ncbi:MAG: DegT/DnrJ/EryC1/StrS aminotransferase family protein [Armatimonadetes bacterium]|nr:DegT/DnrJ/EryC1/StrS aminotransferase family protein [Armatimonadota bacterium]
MFRREPPIVLDLAWTDLVAALLGCLPSLPPADPAATQGCGPGERALTCLCVRSAFDLLMRALALPAGSEILVTAITHPDMMSILRHHYLIPVPVDVEPETLAPLPDALERALSSRSKALLLTHLFGGRLELDFASDFCRRHGLLLLEDCAQAYRDREYRGDSRALASMFSFGPLKTSTALGGALVWVRGDEVHRRMADLLEADPACSNREYAGRVLKYGLLHFGLQPVPYSSAVALLERRGTPSIEMTRRWMHSFPGDFDVRPLRRRPSPALLRMLARRLRRHDVSRVQSRRLSGELSLAQMPSVQVPGCAAQDQSWWIFPVLVEDPVTAMAELRKSGFEAVPGLSNLIVLDPPDGRCELAPHEARRIVRHSMLIPVRVRLNPAARLRLSQVVGRHALPVASPLSPRCHSRS